MIVGVSKENIDCVRYDISVFVKRLLILLSVSVNSVAMASSGAAEAKAFAASVAVEERAVAGLRRPGCASAAADGAADPGIDDATAADTVFPSSSSFFADEGSTLWRES